MITQNKTSYRKYALFGGLGFLIAAVGIQSYAACYINAMVTCDNAPSKNIDCPIKDSEGKKTDKTYQKTIWFTITQTCPVDGYKMLGPGGATSGRADLEKSVARNCSVTGYWTDCDGNPLESQNEPVTCNTQAVNLGSTGCTGKE